MSNQRILAQALWINYEEKIVLKKFTVIQYIKL
jgi:hypothetical protein